MDDSDEYEFDDFVLDEQTIAALDRAEQKYQGLSKPPTPPVEPVNKRHKSSWKPSPGVNLKYVASDDFDDLPEISVRGDGSYGIRSIATKPIPVVESKSRKQQEVGHSFSLAGTASSSSTNQSRQNQQPVVPLHSNTSLKKGADKTTHGGINPNVQGSKSPDSHLEAQLQQLRKKLDELREENVKTQSALKEAVERRLVKEGEVSVLRKTIEKSAQNHAAQIAQLKVAKEKFDGGQLQIQKELKEEMERLRTELMFTQHDLEVSSRKPPASVRGKKSAREIPATPLSASTPRLVWNRENSRPRNAPEGTPLRLLHPPPPVFKASPTKNTRQSPDKKKAWLPGFQNAFETSTPLRSPSKRQKGKEKAESLFAVETSDNPFSFSAMPPAPSKLMKPQTQMTIPSNALVHGDPPLFDEDVEMVTQESDEGAVLDEEPFEPINWKTELSRVILTHSHPSLNESTLHLILSSSNTVEDNKSYSAACTKILAFLATSTTADDLEGPICTNFMSLLEALCQTHQSKFVPMFALFELLTNLMLSIPTFRKALLSSSLAADESHSRLMNVIQKVLLEQLLPERMSVNWNELAESLLFLLESICFNPSPRAIRQLQIFSQNRDVLTDLIQSSHPIWFLERSSRLLALLASHHEIWESLLGPTTDDGLKNSFIDRLCSHLVDMNKPPMEAYKANILTFFGQISIADPRAHAALVSCYTLIPSLVLYTSHLTTPLWEDDDKLVSSKEALSSLIQMINQSIFLLHHLVFGTIPCVNLRSKIQQAPARPFSTLLHIFTVTFGRMSYCEVPSWVDTENRKDIESIAEIARDVLELVIDGPEGDSIWAAFQSEQDEDSTVDIEELEARLMGDAT